MLLEIIVEIKRAPPETRAPLFRFLAVVLCSAFASSAYSMTMFGGSECNRLISAIIKIAEAFGLSLEAKKKTAVKNSQPFLSATTKILSPLLYPPFKSED